MSYGDRRSSSGHVLLPASNAQAEEEAEKPVLIPKHISSWTFGRGTVIWTIWPAVLLHTIFAAFVTTISLGTSINLSIPQVLYQVLGVVIGFVISYRASSGYDRYWMGRTSWSDIVKTSRTLSRLIWINAPLTVDKKVRPDDPANTERGMQEKLLALDMIEGFAIAVKHHLRGETGIYYEDLYYLVRPLHDHKHRQHITHPPPAWRNEDLMDGMSSSVKFTSSISSSRLMKALPPAPIIPAINEYGTLYSETCSTIDDPEKPSLYPSEPRRPPYSEISIELLPFTTFFSYITSLFGRRTKMTADFYPQSEDDVLNDEYSELRRRCAGPRGRKFRPLVPGGGRNIPLEIVWCLSEWMRILEERGTVPMNSLAGMYLCLTAFEDSLSALERTLTTPLPFVYSAHIRTCVWLYLFEMPFEIVSLFEWYTIPGVAIAAFFYLGFLAAGEELQQPFGYDANDLPLDLYCREYIHKEIETLKRTPFPNGFSDGRDRTIGGNTTHNNAPFGIERVAKEKVSHNLHARE